MFVNNILIDIDNPLVSQYNRIRFFVISLVIRFDNNINNPMAIIKLLS